MSFSPVFRNLKENKECLTLESVLIHKDKIRKSPKPFPNKTHNSIKFDFASSRI